MTRWFAVLLLILAVPLQAAAQNRIEARGDRKFCVDTNGSAVFLRRCDNRTSQRWARTLLHEIINVAYPGKCLDAKGATDKDGTAVGLHPCHGKWNQKWEVIGKAVFHQGIRLRGKKACVDIPRGHYRDGNKLILWKCHQKTNQHFIPDGVKSVVTPASAANAGFPAFAQCKRSARKNGCWLNRQLFKINNLTKGDLEGYRYGFNTGVGHGVSKWTLDFGERYSVDRCSKAHDQSYWGPVMCLNDANYLACLKRVRPRTTAERTAKEDTITAYKKITKFSCRGATMSGDDGALPPNDRHDGKQEDTKWQPIGTN